MIVKDKTGVNWVFSFEFVLFSQFKRKNNIEVHGCGIKANLTFKYCQFLNNSCYRVDEKVRNVFSCLAHLLMLLRTVLLIRPSNINCVEIT